MTFYGFGIYEFSTDLISGVLIFLCAVKALMVSLKCIAEALDNRSRFTDHGSRIAVYGELNRPTFKKRGPFFYLRLG